MRTATTVELSSATGEVADVVEFVVEAEKLGLDVCWVAEAWGSDAPSVLGYLAARTQRMLLGSGILQVGVRSPVMVAQTAITLSNLSNGRFLLGLGASGPQVIEGLHGVSFSRPLARIRETVDVVRQAFAGRQNLPFQQGVSDSSPRRRGGADAPVHCAPAPHSDLPGGAVAGHAAVDGGDRRRLAGHQLRTGRRRRRLLHPPRRGTGVRRQDARRHRHLSGRRSRLRLRRRRAGSHGGGAEKRARVQPRRYGVVEHELLQPGLQPARLGGRRRRGASSAGSAATATAPPDW